MESWRNSKAARGNANPSTQVRDKPGETGTSIFRKGHFVLLDLDFETRSDTPIDVGPSKYAAGQTEIICAAVAFEHETVPRIWTPAMGHLEDVYPDVRQHMADDGQVSAHNAPFDAAITRTNFAEEYGWIPLQDHQLTCTMALALQHNLPAGLEEAAKVLRLPHQKDMDGNRLMHKYCKPVKKTGTWCEQVPEELERIYRYCAKDLLTHRALRHALFAMPAIERRFWCLDQDINARGVGADVPALVQAGPLLAFETARYDADTCAATGGAVKTVKSHVALAKYLGLESVSKDVVEELLEQFDNGDHMADDGMSVYGPSQIRALEIRQAAGLSSTSKVKAMLKRLMDDGRMRDMYQYMGASTTGREAGRGPQPQNMTRPVLLKHRDVEIFLDGLGKHGWTVDEVEFFFGPTLRVLADSIRGFFKAAPGTRYVQIDFSSVEGCALAWLSNEEWVLDIYRTHGKVYEASAARIYGCAVDEIGKEDPRRQIGKVAELAMGYQGGVGAFKSMGRNYGVNLPDDQVEQIRDAWRAARPRTTELWTRLEIAAFNAVSYPGQAFDVGARYASILYRVVPAPGGTPFLFCKLPSGRNIAYAYPAIEPVETPWGEVKDQVTYLGKHPKKRNVLIRRNLYGGALTENVIQALARDLQRDMMLRFDADGWNIVHHCHDEVLCEVNSNEPRGLDAAQDLARVVPDWAAGFPLNAGGWEGVRYKK